MLGHSATQLTQASSGTQPGSMLGHSATQLTQASSGTQPGSMLGHSATQLTQASAGTQLGSMLGQWIDPPFSPATTSDIGLGVTGGLGDNAAASHILTLWTLLVCVAMAIVVRQ